MKPDKQQLRIATYNVHKCRGMDRRTSPERIGRILQSLDADVIGLQEVLDVRGGRPKLDQARYLAKMLPGYCWSFGENRLLYGGKYGNMTFSRHPITFTHNYALPHTRREPRGCLRTDVTIGERTTLHVFNLHMGTGFMERRHQAQYLLDLLDGESWISPRVIFGDFNEWTHGLTSRRMSDAFDTFEPGAMLKSASTYPGFVPFLHLDHFYYDPALRLERMELVRNRETLLASDHLPLVASFLLR
ncbi:MAG: endonuclease/exonuclease/phosphatase family protein [Acidobacteriaceae bacterium]